MLHYTCICFSALLLASAVAQTCNINTGPAGTTECVALNGYSGKQYATCLTNVYIQRKSGGRHICRDFTATYCWYQCMIEHYDVNSGIVNSVCLCNNTSIPTSAPVPALPAYCYSPTGEDCTWYTNCLEKKYPCGAEAGYALAFGKKYCELYAQNYQWFSSELTKKWVDATRQCLQLALVPLIRPYVSATCNEIKTTALNSHVGCYTSRTVPYNRPSICDLVDSVTGSVDLLKILWTIKTAFVEYDWRVFSGTWSSLLDTVKSCASDYKKQVSSYVKGLVTKGDAVMFELTVKLLRASLGRKKRSTTDATKISVEFTGALSDRMGWKARGIEGLSLSADSSSQDVVLRVLISGRDVIKVGGTNSSSVNLSAEVEKVKLNVRDGSLTLQLNDGQFYLSQMSDCTDSTCQNTKSTTVAPAVTKGSTMALIAWTLPALCAWMHCILHCID